MEIAENLRKGMTPEEARSAALRRFGGVAQVKETYRETHSLPVFQVLWQDLRYGFRMLRRSPGFSLLAILCLTLGIGANAAVFSWIEGILLRPFPVGRPPGPDDGHRRMEPRRPRRPRCLLARLPGSSEELHALRRVYRRPHHRGLRSASATGPSARHGSIVSANYFDALGVRPILGRGFEPAENIGRNAHPVTVISYQMWQARFNGDPAIIGKTQMLNGMPHTIIGVAPEGFYGTFVGWAMQFWVPVSMQERFDPGGYKLEDRGARWIEGFVRLKPGVTPQQAQAEISAVAKRLETAYPATNRGSRRQAVPAVANSFQQRAARCSRRLESRSPWWFLCSSSRARTSAICCWSGPSGAGMR